MYCGFAKTPEEAKGFLRVATNKKIAVTVVGETDILVDKDLGGYYVIHGRDLKALLQEKMNAGDKVP